MSYTLFSLENRCFDEVKLDLFENLTIPSFDAGCELNKRTCNLFGTCSVFRHVQGRSEERTPFTKRYDERGTT